MKSILYFHDKNTLNKQITDITHITIYLYVHGSAVYAYFDDLYNNNNIMRLVYYILTLYMIVLQKV